MSMHYLADAAFDDLLAAWRHHDDLSKSMTASTHERFASWVALDEARVKMRRLRHALHPTPEEREAAAAVILCDTLDEVVNLTHIHRVGADPFRFRCICGDVVTVSRSADVSS